MCNLVHIPDEGCANGALIISFNTHCVIPHWANNPPMFLTPPPPPPPFTINIDSHHTPLPHHCTLNNTGVQTFVLPPPSTCLFMRPFINSSSNPCWSPSCRTGSDGHTQHMVQVLPGQILHQTALQVVINSPCLPPVRRSNLLCLHYGHQLQTWPHVLDPWKLTVPQCMYLINNHWLQLQWYILQCVTRTGMYWCSIVMWRKVAKGCFLPEKLGIYSVWRSNCKRRKMITPGYI